jgi:hypothetical protein
MTHTRKKVQISVFILCFLLTSSHVVLAQCKLVETTQYTSDNKVNSRQINTYDKKGNLINRSQSGSNMYQSQTSFNYNDQNKSTKSITKIGDKIVKIDSTVFEASGNKENKTNGLGEKSSEETVENAKEKVKTTKDAKGNIIQSETTRYENGIVVFKEIKNDKNQIVSRETVELDEKQNPFSVERFDGIINNTNTDKYTYNANNQLINLEKLINNIPQARSNFTYQKNKLIKKDNYDKDNKLVYYQSFTYDKNLSTESIFYEGILHSKIITTFDKQNNPIEIQNFNEKQKLTSKIINVFDCTQKL